MVEIRLGQEGDYVKALECIKGFSDESFQKYNLGYDRDTTLSIMPNFVNSSLVMYKDDELIGVIAGYITNWLPTGEKVFQEIIWFVKPEHRRYSIKLFNALEDQCKKWGISRIIMAYFGDIELKDFYVRKGYKFLEAHYLKNLTEDKCKKPRLTQ